jgi:Pyrimidine dimer DNA glycosylase
VQTFLPYPDFDRSAACLDSPRLGKQRVETLQILRALTFPSYGWSNHPATLMWRGYVPALTSYGLAMADAWIGRGAADTTRAQIAEFAPEAASTSIGEFAVPSWLGREDLHRSHQSNLIRKDAAFYAPQFPGVPDDLDYVWPGTDPGVAQRVVVGTPLVILRPHDDAQLAEWRDGGGVVLGENSPSGKSGPKWLAQLEAFSTIPDGTRIALLERSGTRLLTGEFTGGVTPFADDREVGLRRAARFDGEVDRSEFPYPALLQDPRTLFEVIGPLI